jgi:hypothetical protein
LSAAAPAATVALTADITVPTMPSSAKRTDITFNSHIFQSQLYKGMASHLLTAVNFLNSVNALTSLSFTVVGDNSVVGATQNTIRAGLKKQ